MKAQNIDEGKQFFLSPIDFMGLDEAHFEKARKDLLVKPGDVYNQSLVESFIPQHRDLVPIDGSQDPRFNVQLDEHRGTVAIAYDFRRCGPE